MKNKLRQLREEKGITQEELGRLAGVSRQTIHAIEAGKFEPSVWAAYALAKVFGLTIEEVFCFEESPRPAVNHSACKNTAEKGDESPAPPSMNAPVRGDIRQELVYKQAGDYAVALTYLPPLVRGEDPAPVYYCISGGGWNTCSREAMLCFSAPSVEALRRRGFAVVSPDYRVTGGGVSMDDAVSDCLDGLRYLARHAAILGVDPHRIVVSGHSAGGHLALLAAYAPPALFRRDSVLAEEAFTVRGVAPICGPTILYPDGEPLLSFPVDDRFACGSADSEEARRCSPIVYVGQRKIPALLVGGLADPLVYPANHIRFARRCEETGTPCTLLLSENGGHCLEPVDPSRPSAPDMAAAQQAIAAFALACIGREEG